MLWSDVIHTSLSDLWFIRLYFLMIWRYENFAAVICSRWLYQRSEPTTLIVRKLGKNRLFFWWERGVAETMTKWRAVVNIFSRQEGERGSAKPWWQKSKCVTTRAGIALVIVKSVLCKSLHNHEIIFNSSTISTGFANQWFLIPIKLVIPSDWEILWDFGIYCYWKSPDPLSKRPSPLLPLSPSIVLYILYILTPTRGYFLFLFHLLSFSSLSTSTYDPIDIPPLLYLPFDPLTLLYSTATYSLCCGLSAYHSV